MEIILACFKIVYYNAGILLVFKRPKYCRWKYLTQVCSTGCVGSRHSRNLVSCSFVAQERAGKAFTATQVGHHGSLLTGKWMSCLEAFGGCILSPLGATGIAAPPPLPPKIDLWEWSRGQEGRGVILIINFGSPSLYCFLNQNWWLYFGIWTNVFLYKKLLGCSAALVF